MIINNKYIIGSIILILLDITWIQLFMGQLFVHMIFNIQKEKIKINYFYVILSYIWILFSYNYFVIRKSFSIIDSFLFGCAIYGIYEFTNASLFSKWNNLIIFLDILWGGTLYGLTTWFIQIIKKDLYKN